MFKQRSKPLIFTFYCFTIFATGIASVIFIYSIIYPNDIYRYDEEFILDNLTYQRFFGFLVYMSLIGVYFIIGVSMVQLSLSFDMIFHQGSAEKVRRSLTIFVIGFISFFAAGVLSVCILLNLDLTDKEYERRKVFAIAKLVFDSEIAIQNTIILVLLYRKLRNFNNDNLQSQVQNVK